MRVVRPYGAVLEQPGDAAMSIEAKIDARPILIAAANFRRFIRANI